jgi:hypothetical protein
MERLPMFVLKRIDVLKIAILVKTIYRFSEIPTKIPKMWIAV